MRYLSIDLEATGLAEDDLIIEWACVPFCTQEEKIYQDLSFHHYISCPSFNHLRPKLSPWVLEHNKQLIEKAHREGLPLSEFQKELTTYLESAPVQSFFSFKQIILFGKSMAAIDLPFMVRDFGWEWMRRYFSHRQLDLSATSYALIDLDMLPSSCASGSGLMAYLGMGEVAHTALQDATHAAQMYLKILADKKRGNEVGQGPQNHI